MVEIEKAFRNVTDSSFKEFQMSPKIRLCLCWARVLLGCGFANLWFREEVFWPD